MKVYVIDFSCYENYPMTTESLASAKAAIDAELDFLEDQPGETVTITVTRKEMSEDEFEALPEWEY